MYYDERDERRRRDSDNDRNYRRDNWVSPKSFAMFREYTNLLSDRDREQASQKERIEQVIQKERSAQRFEELMRIRYN